MDDYFCCPNCGNPDVQMEEETTTHTHTKVKGSGYSGTQGCLGYLMLGPVGLLCGSCGQKPRAKTKTYETTQRYWVCNQCGHTFPDLETLEREYSAYEKAPVIQIVVGAVFALLAFIIFGSEEPVMGLVTAIMPLGGLSLSAWISKKTAEQKAAKIYELKTAMEKFRKNNEESSDPV